MTNNKIMYIKGGCAIEEATHLFPLAGAPPKGGPDQFLLSMLICVGDAKFRLVSLGATTKKSNISSRDAFEYGVRPNTASKYLKGFIFIRESIRFMYETSLWKPSYVVCGIDGVFAIFAFIAARVIGAKYIFSVHNALLIPGISKLKQFVHKYIVSHASSVIVHGPFLYDQAIACGAKRNALFEYNSGFDIISEYRYDVEEIKPVKAKNIYGRIFLYGGRIEADKGIFDLLTAFTSLCEIADAHLVYAGDGSGLKSLREMASKSPFAQRISILGPVTQEKFYNLTREAMVVITPSQSRFPEGRCKTAMEALILGVPVIAPEYGPFPYLISHGVNGLLYKSDDVAELTSAMLAILNDMYLLITLQRGATKSGILLTQPHENFIDVLRKTMPR
jgi:glycosyltransferase involved in cell wall biosynthesis